MSPDNPPHASAPPAPSLRPYPEHGPWPGEWRDAAPDALMPKGDALVRALHDLLDQAGIP